MSYEVFSSVYDTLTQNVDYQKTSDYICSLLSQNGVNGGLLLDLACGTGSLSVKLSQKGFEVIGVDGSEDMLMVAQNKAYEQGQHILFLCQQMENLDLYGTIDGCVCTLDSINHLKDIDAVKKVFQKVSLFMNEGGIFVFDVNTIYKHKNILANNTFIYDLDDVFCAWQNELVENTNTVKINLNFFIKDEDDAYERLEESFQETAYTEDELINVLKESGFEVLNIFDEMTTNKPNEKTQRMVFVAKRVRQIL